MSFLNQSIVDAMLIMASGYAFADGLASASLEVMTDANIASSLVTVAPPIAEPQSYLHRFDREYGAAEEKTFRAQTANLHSAYVTRDFQIGAGNAAPTSPAPTQQTSNLFSMGASTAPLLSLAESSETTVPGRTRTHRRLVLTVDDWTFSGSARVINNKGVTLTVRRRF